MNSSPPPGNLWIVHGQIDIPVCFPVPANKSIERLYVGLGGMDLDGFVELRPLDCQRSTTSVFWTATAPLAYEFRAGVMAPDSVVALLRGTELAEHLSDRLTLLTGYPIRPLSIGVVYNELQLSQCISGERTEYDLTTGGEEAFRTQLPKNWALLQLLAPPEHAFEAIRWFRHAMLSPRSSDQYLAYYIALEAIAQHVPGVSRRVSDCTKCGKEFGTERWEVAALRYLIARHPQLPPDAGKVLAKIRARIAHGNTDYETLELASANLLTLQRLAADGIALALGIEPGSFNVLAPSSTKLLVPIGHASYSQESNPISDWGDLLSNQFAKYVSAQSTTRSDANTPSPVENTHD
jgi:hypothetical protein